MDKELNKKEEPVVRVQLGEDGIIYTYLGGRLGEAEIKKFVDEKIKVLKTVKEKTGSFADFSEALMHDPTLAGPAKRMIVGELKDLELQKVDRMALYGGGVTMRVIGTVLGMALGIKDVRTFADKNKALSWLKEDRKK